MLSSIDPKQLAREASLEHLRGTADSYFKALSDPTPWMIKPFSSLVEAPELLQNIGLLLAGLHLGKTMTVLDFGAGPCWFSRILSQLQCQTIACDVSDAALEIGKRLFAQMPVLGEGVFAPRFLPFNGRRIDLPNESVDRIACNDAFHHVPNQEMVLSEFARILKPGGIAGFSEPGRYHSSKTQSQMEMKNYGVLENDIDLTEICGIAMGVGFTRASCKLVNNMDLTLKEYETLLGDRTGDSQGEGGLAVLEANVFANIRHAMTDKTIFFLHKGELLLDSRSHVGLSHSMDIEASQLEISLGERLEVDVTISNTGTAQWLNDNVYQIGTVRLGTHLYDEKSELLALDFTRHVLGKNVLPNEKIRTRVTLEFPHRGVFTVAFDLVSEGVSWFEVQGSEAKYLRVRVR